MNKTIENLLSCPFCGGNASRIEGFRSAYESRGRVSFMECNNCGAQGEKFSGIDCHTKAIQAWNNRKIINE